MGKLDSVGNHQLNEEIIDRRNTFNRKLLQSTKQDVNDLFVMSLANSIVRGTEVQSMVDRLRQLADYMEGRKQDTEFEVIVMKPKEEREGGLPNARVNYPEK